MSQGLTPAQILAQIDEAKEAHVSEDVSHVKNTTVSFYVEYESNSPIFDSFYKDGGSNEIRFLCNFTAPAFD